MAVYMNGGGSSPSGAKLPVMDGDGAPAPSAPAPTRVSTSTYNEEAAKQEFKRQLESQGFETNKLDYQWQIEKQQVAKDLETLFNAPKCGDPLISLSQAQKAASYWEGIGQPEKASGIREYYSTFGTAPMDRKIGRAEDIGYGPWTNLEPYKENGGYRLDKALEAGVVTKDELIEAGFPEEAVEKSIPMAGVGLGAGLGFVGFGTSEFGFGKKTVEPSKSQGLATVGWDPHPDILYGAGAADWVVELVRPDGYARKLRFDTKAEAEAYARSTGYRIGGVLDKIKSTLWGMTPWKSEFPQPTWKVLGTPEFTLASAGLAQFAGGALPSALSKLVPAKLITWGAQPVTVGPRVVQLALTGGKAALTKLTMPTIATTLAGSWAGLSYKPKSPSIVGSTTFQEFKSSPRYTEAYAEYMKEAGKGYDTALRNLRADETLPSKDKFLRDAAEDFDPQLRKWFVAEAGKGMEYQPGLMGVLGRGGAVLNLPIQQVQALPGPQFLKNITTGMYSVFAPLSITQQLYPQKGPAALTTLIPYYGPITAATALTWKEQPWYGKALGIGFTAAPFALPIMKYGWQRGAPQTHYPFPKKTVTYGPKGEVYVNMGSEYGWLPYENALEVLRTDVGYAKAYQPPSVFGSSFTGRFWSPEPQPMVLGRQVGIPPLVEAGALLRYSPLEVTLSKTPYLSRGPGMLYPTKFYSDTIGPSPFVPSVAKMIGTKVYGESGILPGGKFYGVPPIQAISLGDIRGMPSVWVGPGSFSPGVRGSLGWAGPKVGIPPMSLEPYALLGGGSRFGGGNVFAPPLPGTMLGMPSVYTPSTMRGTMASVLQELRSRGLVGTQRVIGIPIPGVSTIPGRIPGITPLTVTPGLAGIPQLMPSPRKVSVITGVGVIPTPGTFPSSYPSPLPFPSPLPLPFTPPSFTPVAPSVITPTPPGPGTKVRFPWWKFGSMGGLGGGAWGGRRRGGLLGIGKWAFRGFPVGGTHPLTGQPVGYTYMGGETRPYGIEKSVPKVKSPKTSKNGKAGVIRLYRS